MSIFELMMVLIGFGTFLIALLGLVITLINKK
ncbi:putative holin-like toxin [Aquibacillus saliphilus]|nr:putative holin-like toxin [Aquibacillus saliphilus]